MYYVSFARGILLTIVIQDLTNLKSPDVLRIRLPVYGTSSQLRQSMHHIDSDDVDKISVEHLPSLIVHGNQADPSWFVRSRTFVICIEAAYCRLQIEVSMTSQRVALRVTV